MSNPKTKKIVLPKKVKLALALVDNSISKIKLETGTGFEHGSGQCRVTSYIGGVEIDSTIFIHDGENGQVSITLPNGVFKEVDNGTDTGRRYQNNAIYGHGFSKNAAGFETIQLIKI